MVSAVASRVVPRHRISKAMAKEAAVEASRMERLADNADVPKSVMRIPTRASADTSATGVAIRPMGNSRRVFLLDPHLQAEEIEGLAYRIQALSKNEGINSVFIASDDKDDAEMNCLPRYVTEIKDPDFGGLHVDFEPSPNHTWHVSGGYDPLQVAAMVSENSGDAASEKVDYLMESIKKLSLATKGDERKTRIPVITMPHGIVTDAGYSLCMGSYMLATRQTSFRILNPSRGLSLDPVGFSYILPRLGREQKQRSAKYPGCGMILALCGYEANCFDMVETGLATHLVIDTDALPLLEENLATIPPWHQQRLVRKPRHFYDQQPPADANAKMRNVMLANLIDEISEHSWNPNDSLPFDFSVTNAEDPALDVDQVPWDSGFFSSDLVDMAAHFDKVFRQEKSLQGLMERLREIGSKQSDDSEEQLGFTLAKDLVDRMDQQSPLALQVVHHLLKMGSSENSTMEKCMALEANAQKKLLTRSDFLDWARHVNKHGGEAVAPAFAGWKHESVSDVSPEEVDEILS